MAGKIPQHFIDDLLHRIDIVDVIDRRVQLKKSGKNYSACCPFHDEKTPSFTVAPDKQFYHCFGCQAGGNAISFIMEYDRLDFPQAVEQLANLAGLEVPREASAFREQPKKKQNLYSVLEQSSNFYRDQLRNHAQAQRAINYLKERGLSGEIAKDFEIGFAPPGWDNLLKTCGSDNTQRQLLEEAGMLIVKPEENKCYDRFRDRIMFPIKDNRGRVIAFGGRVLGDDKPKYLNSPETPVFHKSRELYGLYQARQANRQLQRIIIVEGYMDVVALAQFDIRYAVATLGTATSSDHLKLLFRHTPEAVFCFDGDQAGRSAAKRALESALPVMEDGRQARFLFLPDGEDPDSLVRKEGKAAFEHRLNNAQPLESFLFDVAAQECDLNTLEGKARMSQQAAPLIAQLPDGIFRELVIDQLAQTTGLSRERLEQHLQTTPPQTSVAAPAPPPQNIGSGDEPYFTDYDLAPAENNQERYTPPERPRQPRKASTQRNPALHAIGLLLHTPQLAEQVSSTSTLKSTQLPHMELLVEMIELMHRRPETDSSSLLGQCYASASQEVLSQALSYTLQVPDEGVSAEFADTIKHIEKRAIKSSLSSVIDKYRNANYSELSQQQKLELLEALKQSSKH